MKQQAERRHERRNRTLKGARISFNGGYSTFDCVIRNLTDEGAQIEMASLLGIPVHFDLIVEAGAPPRACRVVWRTEKRMGVSFLDSGNAAA